MDFMKVFDQTVREIKREVNLKVLKVPEIEQKVLDATDDVPWGPHGTVLAEIAQATKKFSECQLVMNVLWTRLTETDKNWRFVYKALAVIEYLVAHGSERAVDDIVEHTYQISSLVSFDYVEPSGKDMGINVKKKAETIVALLNNKDKIQEARSKASANREKYVGLSSSGITYKSGAAASFSSSNFKNSDRYGGFGSTGDSDTFTDSVIYGEDRYVKNSKSKKEPSRYDSEQESPATVPSTTRADKYASATPQSTQSDKYDDDFDDFDPRGTLCAKPSAGSNQVDLFGANFVDLFDAQESVAAPTDTFTTSLDIAQVDLFADADFVSAPSQEVESVKAQTNNVDLFAQQPSTVDFFAAPDPVPQPENHASKPADTISSTISDPFAAVPLNDFNGSDPFGTFTSQADPLPTVYNQNSSIDGNVHGSPPTETKQPLQKEAFQVKSGIWADSLSRGLIDLNITAPTKVNLAGVGIVGGLSDGTEEKDKRPLTSSFYMGGGGAMGMGIGSGVGINSGGFTSTLADDDGFFSSLSTGSQQNQFGRFQK